MEKEIIQNSINFFQQVSNDLVQHLPLSAKQPFAAEASRQLRILEASLNETSSDTQKINE